MDLVSCYGKALEHVAYPVGYPVFLDFPNHKPQTWLPLKEFLIHWGEELVPNCWYAILETVGGPLSFDQDLLFSSPKTWPPSLRCPL